MLRAKSGDDMAENDPRALDLGDTGGSLEGRSVPQAPFSASTVKYDHQESTVGTINSPKIERLIDLALRGALPRSRALKDYEPDKLSSRHIGCILLRAAGYKVTRIAELMGYTVAVVSVILNHPDGRTILAAILAEGAKNAVDISTTVQNHAPEMLNIVRDIAEDPEIKKEVRLKAAFGWLGMYERDQERQKGSDTGADVKMASEDAARLSDAIRESAGLLPAAATEVGDGSGATPPEPRPELGSLPKTDLPSDVADESQLDLTPAEIRTLLDERSAELEAELEQRIQVMSSPADPSFPRPAGVGNNGLVSNSRVEEVA